MVQRIDFSVPTNLGNVSDPVRSQDAATKAYVDANTGGALKSAITVGIPYVADGIGILIHPLTSAPSLTGVSGTLTAITDAGLINITSTPFPPTVLGANTNFLIIEAADFSWSGTGNIQTDPANAITQVAWIRPPAANLAGTSFTNARIWVGISPISTTFVGTTLADADNRSSATTLLFPDLNSNSISTGGDNYGGTATSLLLKPTINEQIATNIGVLGSGTSGYSAGNVSSVTLGFGNAGTTWQVQTTQYAAAVTYLRTTGAIPPAEGASGNWTLPSSYPLYLSNVLNPTASQFATVTEIDSNPANSVLVITFTGNAPYFANAGAASQPLYMATGRFAFAAAPQTEVIRLAQTNTVSSLNTLKGDLNLIAGTGIGISATSPNITITNTGSGGGISASNWTSFVVNSGPEARGFAFATTNSPGSNAACIGFGVEPDNSPVDGGFIGTTKYIGTTRVANPNYGFGILFPVAATYTDIEVMIWGGSFTCDFTTTVDTTPAAFILDTYLFSRGDSTAANPPDLNANIFPGFTVNSQSDDIQFIPLRPGGFTVTGGPRNFSISVTGGVYSAVGNNYTHLLANTTVPYIPWHRITGADINSVSNLAVSTFGGLRALVALPGIAGATPTLSQVLTIGNVTGNNAIIYQDAATIPNQVSLQAPAAVSTSYALRLPPAQATAANQVLINDGAGNLSWGQGGSGGGNFSAAAARWTTANSSSKNAYTSPGVVNNDGITLTLTASANPGTLTAWTVTLNGVAVANTYTASGTFPTYTITVPIADLTGNVIETAALVSVTVMNSSFNLVANNLINQQPVLFNTTLTASYSVTSLPFYTTLATLNYSYSNASAISAFDGVITPTGGTALNADAATGTYGSVPTNGATISGTATGIGLNGGGSRTVSLAGSVAAVSSFIPAFYAQTATSAPPTFATNSSQTASAAQGSTITYPVATDTNQYNWICTQRPLANLILVTAFGSGVLRPDVTAPAQTISGQTFQVYGWTLLGVGAPSVLQIT